MDLLLKKQLEDQFNLITSANNLEELDQGLLRCARCLGFEYFAYGAKASLPISAPKLGWITNYPARWQQQYFENDYVQSDPTIAYAHRNIAPLIWTDELFSDVPSFWKDARSFGLKHGWAQSSFFANGVTGLLSLSRSAEPLGSDELGDKTPLLLWFNQLVQLGVEKHLFPSMLSSEMCELTSRELEVLRWTADGKTSSEVASILSISERTINFHLRNILQKFKVNNKISAAVKALALGMI